MARDDPVAWVPRDRYWTRANAALRGARGVALGADAGLHRIFFGWDGSLAPTLPRPFGTPASGRSAPELLALDTLAALVPSGSLPSRRPVSGRLGIAAGGLVIPKVFGRWTLPWDRIGWRDAEPIEVADRRGTVRVRLPPNPATRLRPFFRPGSVATQPRRPEDGGTG